MQTLADFKRLPVGTKLKLIATSMTAHKYFNITRAIEHVQTNAIRFEGGSWLEYPKASDITFNGKFITYKDSKDPDFFIRYELIK